MLGLYLYSLSLFIAKKIAKCCGKNCVLDKKVKTQQQQKSNIKTLPGARN